MILKKLQELLGQINEAERKCIEKIILLNENKSKFFIFFINYTLHDTIF